MAFGGTMMTGMFPQQARQSVDFSTFDDETLKAHLQSRNLSVKGHRQQLIDRLKEEVNKAWSQYYAHAPAGGAWGLPLSPPVPLVGGKKKKKKAKKRKRSQLTDEEKAKLEEERQAARERKEARKAENRKRMEEARERKRLKKEESAKRQAEMEKQQQEAKETRQKQEVFVSFDMKAFSEQLKKSLDKTGKKISSCSYDFSHKGFRVRFNDAAHATKCSQGASMDEPKNIRVPTSLQVLPAPVESRCVFFLDPCHPGHPEREFAFRWVADQGVETRTTDVKTLNLWKASTKTKCSRYGKIVNIYRERGFIVVQFQTEAAAEAMFEALKSGQFLNGIGMLYMQRGTPKKRDRQECDKMYPKPPKAKKTKPVKEEPPAAEGTEKAEN